MQQRVYLQRGTMTSQLLHLSIKPVLIGAKYCEKTWIVQMERFHVCDVSIISDETEKLWQSRLMMFDPLTHAQGRGTVRKLVMQFDG